MFWPGLPSHVALPCAAVFAFFGVMGRGAKADAVAGRARCEMGRANPNGLGDVDGHEVRGEHGLTKRAGRGGLGTTKNVRCRSSKGERLFAPDRSLTNGHDRERGRRSIDVLRCCQADVPLLHKGMTSALSSF